MLACIAHARGQETRAQQLLAEAREGAQPHHLLQIYREAQAWQARFQLAAGNLAAVQHWADARPPRDEMLPIAQYVREELIIARLWMAQDEPERALKLLEDMLHEAQE